MFGPREELLWPTKKDHRDKNETKTEVDKLNHSYGNALGSQGCSNAALEAVVGGNWEATA